MNVEEYIFTDIFNIEELQNLQDIFSDANEVASIITFPDGSPITKPSNFCRLCSDFIRKSEVGISNCFKSDAEIGKLTKKGPTVQKCLSGGLLDAGVSITVGDKHFANWLIGQVRNNKITEEKALEYADKIGADRTEYLKAFYEVPEMTEEKFRKIAEMLFVFVNQISDKALRNLQLKNEIEKAEKAIQQKVEKENELIKANNEIKIITENIPNIIWKADFTPDKKFSNTYISDIADDLLLLPKGTINNSFEKYFSYIIPEFIPLLLEIIDNGILNPGKTYSCSYKVTKGNGEIAWFESRGRGFVFSNKIQMFGTTVDISEQKDIENRLIDSEYLLRQSQKVANLGSYILDVATGFWISSPVLDEIFGIDNSYQKNVTGWMEIVHPDDKEMMLEHLQSEVLTEKKPFNKEYRIIKNNDGSEIWVHGMGELEFDEIGRPVKMIGTVQNINDRKRINELLRESEERYRSLVDVSPDAIIVHSNGKIVFANDTACRLLGNIKKEDIIGKSAIEFVHPEDREYVGSRIIEMFQTEKPAPTFEERILRPDGKVIFAEVLATITLFDGVKSALVVLRDITERKKAENKIREKDIQFRKLSANVPDLLFQFTRRLDGSYCVPIASEGIKNIFGCKPEDVIDDFTPIANVIYPEDAERVINDIEYSAKHLTYFTCEFRVILPEKGIQWIYSRSTPEKLEDGSITWYGFNMNITERKKVDEAIQISEEKFRSITEQTDDLISLTNERGIITYASPSANRLFGYNPEEMVGRSFTEFLVESEIPKAFEKFSKTLANGERTKDLELSMKRKNGSLFIGELNGSMFKVGQHNGTIVVIRDITERKKVETTLVQSEENFRLLVSNTFDGILINNKKGDYLYANNKAAEITGYSVEELTKINTMQLTPARYLSMVKERIEKQFFEKEGLSNFESVLVKKSGKEIQIEIAASLTTWKGIQAQIISFRDITVKKKEELELIEAKQKAEESDRLKSAFLANMSHEIRTPMNGILGFTSLLQEPGLTGEEQQTYIDIIQKSGDRMLNTVNDIIEISKIETGQVSTSLKEVNITERLVYLFNFFKPEAELKGIQFSLQNELNVNESLVKTDKTKFDSILTNLIKNAIKYSNTGFISVDCKKKNKQLLFIIKDTGIGIPENRLHAIFERFVQADIEDTRVHEGSGLGLAITKSYVKMLGGEIWVESEEGKGSTFYFTIDYIPVELGEIIEEPEKIEGETLTKTVKANKLLVVEDDEVSFILIRTMLSNGNYRLLRAKNGKEAVEIVKENTEIDLVLMDLKMPVMDGLEATRKIREFNKTLPIIAQTAFALEGDKEKAFEAGCNDYISKPINKQKLFVLMEKLLKKQN